MGSVWILGKLSVDPACTKFAWMLNGLWTIWYGFCKDSLLIPDWFCIAFAWAIVSFYMVSHGVCMDVPWVLHGFGVNVAWVLLWFRIDSGQILHGFCEKRSAWILHWFHLASAWILFWIRIGSALVLCRCIQVFPLVYSRLALSYHFAQWQTFWLFNSNIFGHHISTTSKVTVELVESKLGLQAAPSAEGNHLKRLKTIVRLTYKQTTRACWMYTHVELHMKEDKLVLLGDAVPRFNRRDVSSPFQLVLPLPPFNK